MNALRFHGKQRTQAALLSLMLLVVASGTALAQSGPPELPPIPFNAWNFYPLENPPWADWFGDLPRASTNLTTAPSWDYDGTALSLDTNVAFLQFDYFEGGEPVLYFDNGSLACWAQMNWTSVTDGGTGPSNWAVLISIGNWTSNAAQSGWTIAIDPAGTNLVMEAQASGSNQMVFKTPIDFDEGDWHFVTMTYSPSNSWLYLEGQPVCSNGPILYQPSRADCTNYGFFVGSLSTSGIDTLQGQMQWLATYDYQLSSNEVSDAYAAQSAYITYWGGSLPPIGFGGGGSHLDADPPAPGGTNVSTNYSGGGYGDTNGFTPPAPISTTNYADYAMSYLTITNSGGYAHIAVQNCLSNLIYVVYTNSDLANSNGWAIWQTNVATNTAIILPPIADATNALFFTSALVLFTGTNGLADYWCMEYFGTLNVNPFADPDGDGLCNLDEFTLGLNPTNAHSISSLHKDAQALILAYTNDLAASNHLFITNATANTNILLVTFSPTKMGSNYQIYSQVQSVTNGPWIVETNFLGTNTSTTVAVYLNGRSISLIGGLGWDTDGDSLPDGYEVLATLTDPYLPDTGITGTSDAYKDPDADGYVNIQEYYNGTDPLVFNSPAAPTGLSVTLNSNGSCATISWSSSGSATGYTLQRNTGSGFSTIATISAPGTLYEDCSLTSGVNASYQLLANYALGTSSPSALVNTLLNSNYTTNALIVRGPGGALYIVASAVSSQITAFRVFHTNVADCYYPIGEVDPAPYYYDGSFSNAPTLTNGYFDVPITAFTNGVCQLTTNQVPPYCVNQFSLQPRGTNGRYGEIIQLGQITSDTDRADYDIPFFDGRTNIAQNIKFLLRVCNTESPFVISYDGFNLSQYPESPFPNYVFAGWHFMNGYQSISGAAEMDEFWPFEENNYYLNLCPSVMTFDSYGNATSGVDWNGNFGDPDGTWNFEYETDDVLSKYFDTVGLVSGKSSPSLAPVLTDSISQWIYTWWDADAYNDGTGTLTVPTETNFFGLSLDSLEVGNPGPLTVVSAGSSTTATGNIFADFEQPTLTSNGFYFARLHTEPLPGEDGFTGTNQLPSLLLLPVGGQFSVTAWARLLLQNGRSNINAYAEQYFDKAYLADTNGSLTTNKTGILSEYGEFFATQPGEVLLTTKPDATTGATGQLAVNVIRLSLDVNHDGVMDETFTGPDNTSAGNPFVLWLNNNYDRLTYDSDDSAYYDDDVTAQATNSGCPYVPSISTPDYVYRDIDGNRIIPNTRDLEDFARLWVSGVSNTLSRLPTDSAVTLSWGDVDAPNTANPTIDIFQAADANGGIGYLTNATIANLQANSAFYHYVGRLAPGGSLQLNGSSFTNGWAGDHYIFCGEATGVGQLFLTICDSSGDILAQSSQYIQITDIKQMYERWTVGDTPADPPWNIALVATDNYGPGAPTSQFTYTYNPTTDTNLPYILLVHGWNNSIQSKDYFAECAFKRLYWQGFQGRFGSFRWPTDFNFNGTLIDAMFQPHNYDSSELRAWQSSVGLLNRLTALNIQYPGHVYLLAHSMGNVVAGEALRLAGTNQVVNTYVASQAAIPAHVYDGSVSDLINFEYTSSKLPDWLVDLTLPSYGPSTPNIYSNRLASNSAAVSQRINFYNPNDYALSLDAWCFNQELKPDYYPYGIYAYAGSTNDPSPWNHFEFIKIPTGVTLFDIVSNVNDLHTVMAFAAESRSIPVGAEGAVGGLDNVSLPTIWGSDPSGHSFSDHFWHSAQFRGDYWQQYPYWNALLSSEGFGLK